MNELRNLFEAERERIVAPDAFFTQRVMARFNERAREKEVEDLGIWDIVPGSTRPVLALALVLILCFAAVELWVPQVPERGIVESFLETEQSPAESFLYNEVDAPTRQDVLEQLISPEEP